MCKSKIFSKSNLIILIIALVVAIVFSLIAGVHNELLVLTSPRQQEQVEVIEKRTYVRTTRAPESGGSRNRHFFITFQFTDGSEKEFLVGTNRLGLRSDNVNHSVYDDIQVGDTGILTFRERRDNERSIGRRFISFENDF